MWALRKILFWERSQKSLPGNYPLKLRDAIDRGLKFNLGLLLSGEGERQARGARLNTLSDCCRM